MQRMWLVAVIASGMACDEPLVTKRRSEATHEAPVKPPGEVAVSPGPKPPADSGTKPPAAPGTKPPADVGSRPETPPAAQPPPATPKPIEVLALPSSPTNIAIAKGTLVYTDTAGALWTMPARGGARPSQLSNQHMAGHPMYGNLVAVGDHVVATQQNKLARITVPDGPVEAFATPSEDWLIELVTDGTAVYTNFMDSGAIIKVAPDGTETKLADLPRASLAIRGSTVYAVSYGRGTLVELKGNGKLRTIVRDLRKPTGFAVDDKAAYVWCEGDRSVRKVELATGKTTFLEKTGLENTDELVVDGDWVYAYTWLGAGTSKLVRIAKDGSGTQVLADDLGAPTSIAVDDEAVYVAVQDQDRVIRFDKAAIKPL